MRMPDIYRHLLDRTVENYQVQHLERKFDIGKETRIARLIVKAKNATIKQEEANLRITRVRPLELFVSANRHSVCLPLFLDDYTAPLYLGQSFATAKKLVRENCLNRLRQEDHTVKERDLLKNIAPWALAKYKGPTKYVDELSMKPATGAQSKSSSKAWREMIESITPGYPMKGCRLMTFLRRCS